MSASADEVTPDDPVTGLAAFNNSPAELRDISVLSATVSGGENVVFDWDLGDGQMVHGAVIQHVYPAVGYVTAVVTASNSTNALVSTTRVTITHNAPIIGLGLISDGPTPLHKATHFTATVTAGSNVVYSWNFGDNSPPAVGAGPMVDHMYPAVGSYTTVVTASNSMGAVTTSVAVQVIRTCVVRLNDDPTDYQTVQMAVNASVQASDVVKVSGICVDSNIQDNQPQVYLGKALTIRGGYSPDFAAWDPALYPSTLDANGERYAVVVWGSYTPTLEALRVTNGAQGGIDLESTHAVVKDCEIDHNGTGQWANGGIYAYEADRAMLTGNQIHHNRSVGNGGGVEVNDSPDIILTGNQIYANTAEADEYSGGSRGGGVSLENCPRCQLVDNAIFDNAALGYGWGGGVIVYRGDWNPSDDVLLEGNRIYGNTGYAGGGVYFFGHRGVLRGNWIYQNVTSLGGMGGGIRVMGQDVLLVNNVVAENRTSGYAAGIEINGGTVRMLHNTVARNRMAVEPSIWAAEGVTLVSGSVWMTNTIVVSQPMGVHVSPGNPAIAEGTLWGAGAWANGTDFWGPLVTGTVDIWGDPAFIDPDNLNYHIGAGSAARDAGVDAGITADIDGQPRPYGARPDIGADEFLPDNPIEGLAADNDGPTPLGEATHLTATVTAGTNVSYAWTMGDGATASGAAVAHVYSAAGVYSATVTASNSVSHQTTTTRVTVFATPVSGLSATNDSPTELGQETTLTAQVTGGSSVAYTWDLGDGTPANGSVVAYTYPTVGVYTAVVTASNSVNAMTTTTRITITDIPISGLSAANSGPSLLGQVTTLSASVAGGSNVAYQWAFGDGVHGDGSPVAHIYPAVAVYTAVVTASNTASVVTSTTRVVITDVPIQGLSASNNSPSRLGQATTLNAAVTAGSNVVYSWTFGDGTEGSWQQVPHVYPAAGTYVAAVTAKNGASQKTASTAVTIYETVAGNAGGSQTTSDGVLTMAWSPEMTGTMTVTYTPQMSSSNLTGEFELAGMVFHLEAADQNGNPITELTTPITLTVHYDEAALPPGLDEADLELLRYDAVLGWVKPPQALDTASNTIVVVLDHLSEFALLVRVETGSFIYLPVVMRN